MRILGISAFYHDSAACLLDEGRLVAAAQEERFSRARFDASFPIESIRYCLREAGIDIAGIDRVAFYEKPIRKLDRVLDSFLAESPRGTSLFASTMHAWLDERLRVADVLEASLGYRGPITYARHHESHAASAFFPSPFEEAAVLTVDGVGEWATGTIGIGRGATLEVLHEQRFPHSIGLLYAAFTEFLGFTVLADEYKVMGLAPYGEPRFVQTILDSIVDLKDDGSFRLDLDHFAFLRGEHTSDPAAFEALFGFGPRGAESELANDHMDLARSIQAVTEEIMLRQARFAHRETGARALCLAGGVALNCVANGRIAREGPFDRIWVQPAAGDAGGCVGAAYVAWHAHEGRPRRVSLPDAMSAALLGPRASDDAVESALASAGLASERLEPDAMDAAVASLLAEGCVVGWFDGRMEFGPRALGCRSILADPRGREMQRRVNERIKFREGFRPFAPAVPVEKAARWFDGIDVDRPSPYMLVVAPVTADKRVGSEIDDAVGLERLHVFRSELQAVTHVDGSARVQTVDAEAHPRFHRLLLAFEQKTGCPVLLNTSFNLRGEPIVCTPLDAMRTFLASGMDALAIEGRLVARPASAMRLPAHAPPISPPPSRAALRFFGLQLALAQLVVLVVVGTRGGRGVLVWAIASTALGTALVALAVPTLFRWLEPRWMRIARHVSRVGSRVLFSLVHLFLVVPLGLLRSRPAWAARPDRTLASYWSKPPEDPPRYDQMY